MSHIVTDIIREDLKTISNSCSEELNLIVNSHVVLTGASGFVGKWLALSFLHARRELNGYGLIVLTCRNTKPLRQVLEDAGFTEGYELLESDVRSFPEEVIQNGSLLIHAATPASAALNDSNPLEMFDIIMAGQRRLLDLCSKKRSVRFLFLSSGAVYGSLPMDLVGVPETWLGAPDVTNPSNAYHEAKRAAELLGFTYGSRKGIDFVSARLFAFLAPFLPLDEHFAAGNFIRDAIDGTAIVIKSGGGSVRSYQYATDLCINLWTLLAKGKSGEAYNVGSDVEVKIKDLANAIVARVNPRIPIDVQGIDTPENVSRYVPSISKIVRLSGRSNQMSLDQSVDRIVKWIEERTINE